MWTGAEGNFPGCDARIRLYAFADGAGLPHSPGHAPHRGVILNHDVVEAALPGHLRRDGRWFQGNTQHERLITAPGLHLISRFHPLQGAMACLGPVWWLILLILLVL